MDLTLLPRLFFRFILWIWGWKLVNKESLDRVDKAVFIGYPHTANDDGFVAIPLLISLNIPGKIIVKDSLLKPPFGFILRWLGCIPVDRSKKQNAVEQVAEVFEQEDRMYLLMAPEGTRKRVEYWKTGFYYIAVEAKVPIIMAWIRYDLKTAGLSDPLYPTGDIDADFESIRQFYKDKDSGKYRENASPIRYKPHT